MIPMFPRSRVPVSAPRRLAALAIAAALGAACSAGTPNDRGTVLALADQAEDLALAIEQGDSCDALVRLEQLTTRATAAQVEERLSEQDARAVRERLGSVAAGLECADPADGATDEGTTEDQEGTTEEPTEETPAPAPGPSSGGSNGNQPPAKDGPAPGRRGPPSNSNGNPGGGR